MRCSGKKPVCLIIYYMHNHSLTLPSPSAQSLRTSNIFIHSTLIHTKLPISPRDFATLLHHPTLYSHAHLSYSVSLVYTCSTPPIYSFCYKNSFFSSLPQSTRYTSSLHVILFYTTCTPAIQAVTYLILIIGAFTSSRSTLPCILLYHFTHF